MRTLLLAAASGLALLPSLSLADEPVPRADQDVPVPMRVLLATDLAGVTVTRVPSVSEDVVGATVIERAEIDRRQANEPADVLQLVPGLAVTRTGAFGGITAVRQRGASSDKTLVLIDGLPLNDASQPAGGYDLSQFDMEDVSRVEILSGPQGSLWGSDAIGGVINFVTHQPDGWRASLEGGSFGYVRGAAAFGGASEAGDGILSGGLTASAWRADGVSQADEADGNTEEDHAWAYTVAGQGGWANGRFDLIAHARYQRSRTETDGFPPPNFTLADTDEFAQYESWLGDVAGTLHGPWRTDHTVRYSHYDIDRANLGGFFPSSFEAQRDVVRYVAQHGRASDSGGFQGGLEYETNHATISDGTKLSTENASAFVVVRVNPVDQLSLTGSLRYDEPSDIGGRITGRASAVWWVNDVLSFDAAWGQGFKAPTISQLACDFCFPGGPSIGLLPERAEGYEAGVRLRTDRFEGSLTAYHLEVRDQIDFSLNFPFRYLNLKETRSSGVEVRAALTITDAWLLEGEYAWTDALDVAAQSQLLRIPEHAGSVSLTWQGERLEGVLTIRAESDQADAGGRRPSFVVVDIAGQYDLNDHVQFTARIENLTDTHYQQALSYGEPGITAYVGVRVRGG